MTTAWAVAAGVVDPELPVLTLADLGVLRRVEEHEGRVEVTITPTRLGCPAVPEMRADLVVALERAGYAQVEVRTELAPAWTSDDITPEGRRKLADAGIAPPSARPASGPLTLRLLPAPPVACPRCGHGETEETSRFGPTACTALHRCPACGEPFERVKEL